MLLPGTESLVAVEQRIPLLRGTHQEANVLGLVRRRDGEASQVLIAPQPLTALRGGAGLAKKLGAKNLGLLMVLLSIMYAPSAMSYCTSRTIPTKDKSLKVQKMGCGPLFMLNNVVTLVGLALVLVNSRKFDRYGRSKFKMRLTGSLIIFMGMMLVIAHAGKILMDSILKYLLCLDERKFDLQNLAETARINWYSRTNAYLGLMLEWWGFASLFYNFTPKFVAQVCCCALQYHKPLGAGC